jgi:hypothetical protein
VALNRRTATDGNTDADGEVVAWAWDFGDGATGVAGYPVLRGGAEVATVTATSCTDTFSPSVLFWCRPRSLR